MTMDQFLFMNEAEGTGWVNTRTSKINSAIKDFILMSNQGYNIDNDDIQSAILDYNDLDNLTNKEKAYIVKKVNQKRKFF